MGRALCLEGCHFTTGSPMGGDPPMVVGLAVPRPIRRVDQAPRARAALRVFTSSIARVIGPTPPGTGVIARARSLGRLEVHVADQPVVGAVGARRRSPRRPRRPSPPYEPGRADRRHQHVGLAADRGRSRVREWQCVTVALAPSSSCASGLPTRIERPSTTARRPSARTPGLGAAAPSRPRACTAPSPPRARASAGRR